MNVEFPCEKCGQLMHFAREQTGRIQKCPNCGNDVYIPTPEEELEELPLAPEDQEIERQERELQAERRRLERILAGDEDAGSSPAPARGPAGQRSTQPPVGAGRTSIRGVVVTYLSAMRDSDLHRAEEAFKLLATKRDDVRRFIDQLAADQLPPAELAQIPPAVYQGFLKALRSRL